MTVDPFKGFGSWYPTDIPPVNVDDPTATTTFSSPALKFTVHKTCGPARCGTLFLPHGPVPTPIFMPVGTQGTLKGITSLEIEELDCHLLLANTYFLSLRPGAETLTRQGGLHKLMSWDRNILTDSGGFQMVSLLQLSKLSEEGVQFQSPVDNSVSLLTPEESIRTQHAIGSDICMQLDDTVHTLCSDMERHREGMERSIRWLDRALKVHYESKRHLTQNLYPIIQGGLDEKLRSQSIKLILERKCPGIAIGGLAGGESKSEFCRVVTFCSQRLPANQPRYVMGVGYSIDIVVSIALGVDQMDCVYPTRTARFGSALVPWGQLQLRKAEFKNDTRPIDDDCPCSTCRRYSRACLNAMVNRDDTIAILLTIHNIAFQLRLCKAIRAAIYSGNFNIFCREFLQMNGNPDWAVKALENAGYDLS
ncbi:hypothetical protein P9112_002511 [Eukaryota sp. TZLM1-RC]